MEKLVICGSSDDIVMFLGDFKNEVYPGDEAFVIAVSDGTLLKGAYDEDGVWRFNRLVAGSAAFKKLDGLDAPDSVLELEGRNNDGTDVVVLEGDITWAVLGDNAARPKGARK